MASTRQTGVEPLGDGVDDGLAEGLAADEEQGNDEGEDQAEDDLGDDRPLRDALGVSVDRAATEELEERSTEREEQGHAVLAEERERDGESDGGVGVDVLKRAREDGGHDATDDRVGRLSATDRHVADGHELIGAADDEAELDVAKNGAHDGTRHDRLVQRLEQVELVDGRDKRDDEDESNLDD